MNERDRTFSDAERIVLESGILTAVTSMIARFETAMRSSSAGVYGRWVSKEVAEMSSPKRVQRISLAIAIACLTHLVLLRFVPARLSPAMPSAFWLLCAVGALGVLAAAHPLTAAWRHRA